MPIGTKADEMFTDGGLGIIPGKPDCGNDTVVRQDGNGIHGLTVRLEPGIEAAIRSYDGDARRRGVGEEIRAAEYPAVRMHCQACQIGSWQVRDELVTKACLRLKGRDAEAQPAEEEHGSEACHPAGDSRADTI